MLLLLSFLQAQGTPPASPLTLISRDGRRPVPTATLSGQELIALDDVASLFGVNVREDALAGGITITYRGRTIVMSADQPMASVSGRVVTLPSPVVRAGRRWLVPVEFLTRALAPIYDQRIELRRNSRLLIVGDVRVPQVGARIEVPGPPTRATIEIIPAASVNVTTEPGRVLLRVDADALDLSVPPAGAGLIEQIRAGDQPTTVAMVLNARAGTPRVVQTTADNVTRVLIEVPSNAPAETAAPPARAAGAGRGAAGPGHHSAPGAADHRHRSRSRRRGSRRTRSVGFRRESVTLDVARRLRGLIEARLGVRVILTRDDDRAVGADERAALANNSKADLFLSLHANAAPSPAVAGAEVFYLRLDREGEDARRASQAEAVSLPILGGAHPRTGSDPVGPRAGATCRGIGDPGGHARGRAEQPGHDGPAPGAAGAAACAGRCQHAGGARRDGLSDESRAGEGGSDRGLSDARRAGDLRRHCAVSRLPRRTTAP